MKRSVIAAVTVYLLFEGQRRTERRFQELRARQLADEAHVRRICDEVSENFRQMGDWQRDVVKQIEGAFRR